MLKRLNLDDGYAGPIVSGAAAGQKIEKLVVLPFENLAGGEEQEYFVAGMTDALSAELGRVGSLKVLARTTAKRFKNTDKPPREIARELGVDALVTGAVYRSACPGQGSADQSA